MMCVDLVSYGLITGGMAECLWRVLVNKIIDNIVQIGIRNSDVATENPR